MPTVDSPSPGDPRAATTADAFAAGNDPPWLARKDWASGELCYKAGAAGTLNGLVIGLFGVALLFVAFGFAADVPRSIQAHGYFALIPLLITGPLGLALTLKAGGVMIGGLKTGKVLFHLEAVPVPLGGPLRGELKMSKPIRAGQPVRLKLQCVSQTYTFGGPYSESDSSSSNVVWEDEDTVASDGTGTIQVSFVTPADVPSSRVKPKKWPPRQPYASIWWVVWELSVDDPSGKTACRHAEFEVPVFEVAETARQRAEAASIRAARTLKLESYRPGPDFKVRITPLADGGTEFFFPPVGGAANATFQTVVVLIMAAILVGVSDPLIIRVSGGISGFGDLLVLAMYLVWAILTLLLSLWVLRLWFAPERVVIANGMLSDTAGLFARTRSMPVAQIAAIHVTPGAYTRHNAISVRGPRWRVLSVGDGIREKRDAEWLAMRMSHAAGIKSSASIPANTSGEEIQMVQAFLDWSTVRSQQTGVRRQMQALFKPGADKDGRSS